jgi:imidazolonepropionase
MTTILTNIKQLIGIGEFTEALRGKALGELQFIENAFLSYHGEQIVSFGKMEDLPDINPDCQLINCCGKIVLPAFCDSHTHLVFAASREEEFVGRIKGLTYEEIAARGGGILNSARKLNLMSESDLYEHARQRLIRVMKMGTGAIEIKSGYGLSVDGELKMLRIIKRLKNEFKLPIKATFLGAHAIPLSFKENRQGYIDLIINEMLPVIADEQLADYIDVFCEKNYFTPEETNLICKVGRQYGLLPKLHVNQFNAIGGIQVAAENNAISVDHCEIMNDIDIDILANSKTIATVLPSCSFFLGIPYAPVRKMIDAGIAIALATDYNPGSTPSGNMNFVNSLGCIQYKMTPEESFNACTINGAFAMRLDKKVGSIAVGKMANLIITESISNYNFLPYSFGENHIEKVIIAGEIIE